MQEECDTFFITEEEAGERLDKILAKRFSLLGSRTYFQFLIDEGKVLLNGAIVKKRIKPSSGDEVEIEYVLTPELVLEPEQIPLQVLYEDDAMLVINKSAGMVVHPSPGHWTGTFVNALLFHCQQLREDNNKGLSQTLRPGIVHRIDKDTSGLLIAAKTNLAQQRLIEMFASRQIYKEYLAVCIGNPGEGLIDQPIGRHPTQRKSMSIVANGRPAITEFCTTGFNGQLSVVKIILKTGRTHQIRVHMKYHGTPLLGDPIYGVPSWNAKHKCERQMLHAHRLKFAHPLTGEQMSFTAEPPPSMQELIKSIMNGRQRAVYVFE